MTDQPTQATKEPRAEQIDGLRALAVLGVLYAHFASPDSFLGHYGVRLFFVISGFLITRILLSHRLATGDEGRGTIAIAFYARRCLRIMPVYYLALLVMSALASVRETIGWHALFGSNILFALRNDWYPPVTAHLWTLGVEEQFYIIWPLLILFLPRRWIVPLLFAGILASIAGREVMEHLQPEGLAAAVLMPFSIDALAAGALLGIFDLAGKGGARLRAIPRWALFAISLVLIAIVVSDAARSISIWANDVLLIVPMGLAVLAANAGIGGVAGAFLSLGPLRYLGRISYGVYLWHNPMYFLVGVTWPKLGLSPEVAPQSYMIVAASLATLVVAALSWRLFEQPINGLKRRFPYRGASAVEPVPRAGPVG
ncbi:MAG: acyltransferase [Novosphingobium sp.]|nr:acyltransferase [Novosphingobium sp.]